MASKPRIAVIGAGPSGCTLARLLLVSKVDVDIIIYESEKSLDARTQGGTLDLHTDTGLAALKKAQLYDEFVEHARFDGEAFIVCNKDLKRFINLGGTQEKSTRGRPEIDRIQLRQILIDSLPPDMIKWNHKLQNVTLDQDGKPSLHFDHGVETGFDLVVGGDGAWSKVRNALSPDKPFYSGISGINFHIKNVEKTQPELYTLVNRGSLFSFGLGMGLTAQQLATDAALSVSNWMLVPENWQEIALYNCNDAKASKIALSNGLKDKGWNPTLVSFLEKADEDVAVPRNLYMLRIGHKWTHKPYLTLLGDAAHLMTPFAGEGVNVAMADAMKLADAIISACNKCSPSISAEERALAISTDVKKFEEDMFVRGTRVQQMTKDMMDAMFFDPGGPEKNIETYMYTAISDEAPWGTKWLIWCGLRVYYTIWRWRNLN
ncbi:FAD/NAD(P)-binding domain-containing protein [Rhizodiscina lignyota]|uniref:FAD/NAD(P)-binding domain-containing protein n=1 Tax=Rhizodiscina lignyota TaxID=1504668 RepID=A0A9P4IR46_9PEZI|nr:FAD/NAD(P)-binding domain-containing protein [Rhizodiscina lignyota]